MTQYLVDTRLWAPVVEVISYRSALTRMERLRQEVLAGTSAGELLLCTHPPVVTVGRHANPANLLVSVSELRHRGIEYVEVDRGGDMSYHDPGQLMIYPVIHVGVKVSAFLQSIAEVLAQTAAIYGVDANWRSSDPGLWCGDRKLAACGLHLRKGVTIHGFALNVATPAAAWDAIVPCGLAGPRPISLAESLAPKISVPSLTEIAKRITGPLQGTLGLPSEKCNRR